MNQKLHGARMIYNAFTSQQDRVTILTRIKQRQKIRKVKIFCQMNGLSTTQIYWLDIVSYSF